MKRIIIGIILVAILIAGVSYAHEEKKEPLRFSVTITAEFTAASLQELADKEKKLQKLLEGADIRIQFEQNCPTTICGSNDWGGSFIVPNIVYDNNNMLLNQ